MSIKVLALGEIVTKSGIFVVKSFLQDYVKKNNIDLVIANGEGATGGFGIGKNHALYLRKLGVDVITLGDKGFFKKDLVEDIKNLNFVIRPANYPYSVDGRAWKILNIKDKKVAVISLLGQSGFNRINLNNPFILINSLLEKLQDKADTFIIDFHASTTAEKYSMFNIVDGKVAVCYGTHSKALTADAHIMKGGTGVICDTGRVGSSTSVGGLNSKIEIRKYRTAIPERSKESYDNLEAQGALFTIEDNKCINIETVRVPIDEGKYE